MPGSETYTENTVGRLLAAFQELDPLEQRALITFQQEHLLSGDTSQRYSVAPVQAVRRLRELVNLAVKRPAMDKMSPEISGMDARHILSEILPLVLPLSDGRLLSQVQSTLQQSLGPRPDIESPEDHLEFLVGIMRSALEQLGPVNGR